MLGEAGPAGEGGVVHLGGVEGGEGNKVGWMEEGEEGSCSVGEERGKNTTGLTGEVGEGEACFMGQRDSDVASLVGEEGEGGEDGLVGEVDDWAGWVGHDGEGQETGVEGVVQMNKPRGPEGEGVSEGEQGAAEGDVGDVLISGGVETDKEATGKVSADGDGES